MSHAVTETIGGSDAPGRATPEPPITTAVLLATAPGGPSGAAAALPWGDGTLVERLAGQAAELGATAVHVVLRPAAEEGLASRLRDRPGTHLHVCEDIVADLRLVADLARDGDGSLLICPGEAVTRTAALASLADDPRIRTGALVVDGAAGTGGLYAHPILRRFGRLVSAGSPVHEMLRPDGAALGPLKVAGADRAALAAAAGRLADLAEDPPRAWRRQLEEIKPGSWRLALAGRDPARDPTQPDDVELDAVGEAELGRWLAAAPEDVAALLLTALIRDGVIVRAVNVREFAWARPFSEEAARAARARLQAGDEERERTDSAVKPHDGFFTTFFVSPYTKHLARWCAKRGVTPNQVTVASMLVGALAAAGFATGDRWGLVAGAVLLQVAFALDCVDGQLARYSRRFTAVGAWLDSVFDRGKEYLAYAGLAIGASQGGDGVWALACAALALQTARHAMDYAFPALRQQLAPPIEHMPLKMPWDGNFPRETRWQREAAGLPVKPPAPIHPALRAWGRFSRLPGAAWVKSALALPIGERLAVISLTAALWDAQVTFVVLLVWGGLAAAYVAAGLLVRSWRAKPPEAVPLLHGDLIARMRDDGILARAVSAAAARRAAKLPVDRRLRLARLRWTGPPLVRAVEYGGLIAVAAAAGAGALPAAFALLAVLAFRHYDLVYRPERPDPDWMRPADLGWDGRLLVAVVLLAAGAVTAGFWALAGVLAVLFAVGTSR